MRTYNGHRSWNTWNVALWISNDYNLYQYAITCIRLANNNAEKAAKSFLDSLGIAKTPDGAKYNHLSVKLCLQGFIDD